MCPAESEARRAGHSRLPTPSCKKRIASPNGHRSRPSSMCADIRLVGRRPHYARKRRRLCVAERGAALCDHSKGVLIAAPLLPLSHHIHLPTGARARSRPVGSRARRVCWIRFLGLRRPCLSPCGRMPRFPQLDPVIVGSGRMKVSSVAPCPPALGEKRLGTQKRPSGREGLFRLLVGLGGGASSSRMISRRWRRRPLVGSS